MAIADLDRMLAEVDTILLESPRYLHSLTLVKHHLVQARRLLELLEDKLPKFSEMPTDQKLSLDPYRKRV